MIEVENLTKRYGEKLAVDGLDFVVQPGIVTGFLGPNGAGKSTTMRMIAGLDEPTAGRVRVNGRDYRAAPAPMAELGILLEAKAMHTGRSARNHLLALAQTNGISRRRPGWLQSWQHSTIARRVEFLERLLADPALEARFQRSVGRVIPSVGGVPELPALPIEGTRDDRGREP